DHSLGCVLPDHVLVQMLLDFAGFQHVQGFVGGLLFEFLFDDLVRLIYAKITDVRAAVSGEQNINFFLGSPAK
ncbi:MAG: hypothetical protein AAFN68_04500, partial [Pseudomonadota bacterium]